jgi:hypothetical protein
MDIRSEQEQITGSRNSGEVLETFKNYSEQKYLALYLDEYVFRFNGRATESVEKRFWRMVQQPAASLPITNAQLAALAN